MAPQFVMSLILLPIASLLTFSAISPLLSPSPYLFCPPPPQLSSGAYSFLPPLNPSHIPSAIYDTDITRNGVCTQWTFLHTWDDEYNFITAAPRNSSPVTRPPPVSLITILYQNFNVFRINVYEPVAWTVTKSVITRSLWAETTADELDLSIYSLLVRRQALAIHAANVFLLGVLLALLSIPSYIAASFSLIFGLHPANMEVIGWPSATPYTLACFFTLLAAISMVVTRHSQAVTSGRARTAGDAAACVLYVCAVLSKSAAISVPGALFILDRALAKGKGEPLGWKLHGPLVCLTGVLLSVTIHANTEGTVTTSDLVDYGRTGIEIVSRLVKAAVTLTLYLRLGVFPVDLRAHYVVDEGELTGSLNVDDYTPEMLLATSLWVGVSVALVFTVREPRTLLVALACYAGLFLPSVGLVQHGMIQKGGDRYFYITQLPLVVGASWGFRRPQKGGRARGAFVASAVAVAVALTLLPVARRQLCSYCGDDSLHRHSLAADPTDWRMVDTYAEYLHRSGREQEARVFLERSLDVLPTQRVKGMMTRAKTFAMLGDAGKACDMYFEWWGGHEEDRDMGLLMNNCAICLLRGGQEERNEAELLMKEAQRGVGDNQRERIVNNGRLLEDWKNGGFVGNYRGSLLW